MLARRILARRPCSHGILQSRSFQLPRFSIPVPSNEPLAGTGGEGAVPFSPLFLLEVGIGLPVALWTYKCLMLVLFQRKIIYLPSVPPGTRSESLADGERTPQLNSLLSGLRWKERSITSSAPTRWLRQSVQLTAIELEWKGLEKGKAKSMSEPNKALESSAESCAGSHLVVVYLQGNAGTPLLRLTLFRRLLQHFASSAPSQATAPHQSPPPPRLTLIAAAPRSFWLSTRSAPTEATVLADYRTVIADTRARFPDAKLVLYGHSLGGAAALLLLNEMKLNSVAGLIVENPLPSIPYMVRALYPQRWLPYHWLGFAAVDRWDAQGALRRGGQGQLGQVPSLWIRSGSDEIIPLHSEVRGEEGDGVERMWSDWKRLGGTEGREGKWVKVDLSLHDSAYLSQRWADEVQSFLRRIATE